MRAIQIKLFINNYGTEIIANLSLNYKVKNFVAAESSAIYEGSKTFPTDESVISPKSVYAWTKLSQSYFCRQNSTTLVLNIME